MTEGVVTFDPQQIHVSVSVTGAYIWLALVVSHVRVTVLHPCMWMDFLLWHLIWLTWHQLATVVSHNCHLLTEQGNKNRTICKRPGSGGGERMGMRRFIQNGKHLDEKQPKEVKKTQKENLF